MSTVADCLYQDRWVVRISCQTGASAHELRRRRSDQPAFPGSEERPASGPTDGHRNGSPSDHRALLAEAAGVRAWRAQRPIAGKQRESGELGSSPRVNVEAAKRKLAKICSRQYLRSLLDFKVDQEEQGATRVSVWSDWPEYQQLATRYFGLRILISDRAEWSTAQIIEAYRGQSKVEPAFRDLRDPRMLSTRPQFHWSDQPTPPAKSL